MPSIRSLRPALLSALLLPILLSALPAQAAGLTPESVLQTLQSLGRINGTALACNQQDVVARVKGLVIQRAPKTRQYGEAFETATQEAFLARSRQGGQCPAGPELAREAENLAEQLPPASAVQAGR
jgi:hypothetical protein